MWNFLYLKQINQANNKCLKSYDPKKASRHIVYLDANNSHRYAISEFFPTSGFKWIDPKEIDLNKCTGNSSTGCLLEADLEYSKELHELHND